MRKEVKNNLVYIYLEESITSANAPAFEEFVKNEPANNEDGVIVDAKGLDYISSAGLRVILSMKKHCGNKTFRVENANQEVMSVFEVTGFADIIEVTLAKREISVEGCKRIGAGACGECYRIDDETIIKLYYSHIQEDEIEREKALSKKAFVLGIPTAISYDIVNCDGRSGVVYELIKSKTLSELISLYPENIDHYIDMYVDVCKKIHDINVDKDEIPSFKDICRPDIYKIQHITEEERDLLFKFLDMVPDVYSCLHGDLNINNIMTQGDECVLIDMGELGYGDPMFDISRIIFSIVYGGRTSNPNPDDFNEFYKLPQKTVDYVYEQFMTKYFGTSDYENLIKNNRAFKWLYPLAWLRTICSMHRDNKWTKAHYDLSDHLLRDNLLPFIKEQLNK